VGLGMEKQPFAVAGENAVLHRRVAPLLAVVLETDTGKFMAPAA